MSVHVPEIAPDPRVLNFIVDTGAALTCIHAIDAIRAFGMTPASLDPASWANPVNLSGVGGSSLYLRTPATFGLMRQDGQIEVLTGTVLIGEMNTGGLLSLMGWDLLRFFRVDMDGGAPSIMLHRL